MDIHEYQSKEILAGFGVPIPRGGLAFSPEQAAYRARDIGGDQWVVKAQIHSGGRSKVGGVRLCASENDVYDAADDLFGKRLFTTQSGDEGKVVYRVYVEGMVTISTELYLGFVLDRKAERVMVVASREGGIEIEEISRSKPDSIIRSSVDPAVGMQHFQAREIAFQLGIPNSLIKEAVEVIVGCYRAIDQLDATMVEINPLVVTEDNRLFAVDAKMMFDDNALFRRPDIAELRDKSQEEARESKAADRGLRYVGLNGSIGCLVNGGGLAMATMDMIQLAGAEPANFLDIGGAASPERVAKAYRLVTSDDRVEALLVNIFAGINRCDWVAQGLLQAFEKEPPEIPIVVRFCGTGAEEGRKILSRSGHAIIHAGTLAEASERVATAAKGAAKARAVRQQVKP
jgi:succinyl-CoA synthetase beta subunit/malate-CoA ligase subunit beta